MNSAKQNSHSNFGLTVKQVDQIIQILRLFPVVERAVIFGSRAKGTEKKGSDIDIALFGTNLEFFITRISYQLNEELLLPFFFDVIDYGSINHQELKEHINRVGIEFYKKI